MTVKCKMRFSWLFMNVRKEIFRLKPTAEAIKSLIKISCSIIIWWQIKQLKIILYGWGIWRVSYQKSIRNINQQVNETSSWCEDFNEILKHRMFSRDWESLIKLKLNTTGHFNLSLQLFCVSSHLLVSLTSRFIDVLKNCSMQMVCEGSMQIIAVKRINLHFRLRFHVDLLGSRWVRCEEKLWGLCGCLIAVD